MDETLFAPAQMMKFSGAVGEYLHIRGSVIDPIEI